MTRDDAEVVDAPLQRGFNPNRMNCNQYGLEKLKEIDRETGERV